MVDARPTGHGPSLKPRPKRTSFKPKTELTVPISQVKAEKPKIDSATRPRVPRSNKETGRDLADGIAKEKHTGNSPGFEVINMKFLNNKRQNCTNICTIGIIYRVYREYDRQYHKAIICFSGTGTDKVIYTGHRFSSYLF
jgi:hypothetical protein